MSNWETIYEIGPGENNPRNSEGAFIELNDGSLMFAYSRYTGATDFDDSPADIAKIISKDGGVTWSEPEIIVNRKQYGGKNVMSVSLMRMQNGDIGLFYLNKVSLLDMKVILRRSSDEGKTWSDGLNCMNRNGYFVLNNDRVVRLKSGRILLCCAEHVCTLYDGGAFVKPCVGCYFYSDDDGRTWRESRATVSICVPSNHAGFAEPGCVELAGGLLWSWARTTLGAQYETFSRDNGENWLTPEPSRFTSPLSPLSMKRLADGRLLAVWNPVPQYETREVVMNTGGRSPLVYALSVDEGVTWTGARAIENDERSGFCYTAIYEHKGNVYLAYCAGNTDIDGACLNRIRMRRISVENLKNIGR